MPSKYAIPEGWLKYSKMGEIVENSNIIAMRVPLKPQFKISNENDKFSVHDALDIVENKMYLRVGLVVNLCATDKYYDTSDFESRGAAVKKIMVPGLKVPSEKNVKMFCDVIEEFENANRDNNKIVLVHCTHGLNRTGFMVCSYLIRVKGINPEYAVESFARARGHQIRRQNYVQALLAMKPSDRLEQGFSKLVI